MYIFIFWFYKKQYNIYIYFAVFYLYIYIFSPYLLFVFLRKKVSILQHQYIYYFSSPHFFSNIISLKFTFILLGYYFVVVIFMVSIHRANLNYLYIVRNYNNTFIFVHTFIHFIYFFFIIFLPLFIHRPIRNILTWKSSFFFYFFFYHFYYYFFFIFYYYSTFLFPMSALPVLFP